MRSYSQLVGRIKEASQRYGYEYQVLGYVGPNKQFELPRVIINPENYKKTVVVVAGVHGDEPAPVESVIQFIEESHPENHVRLLVHPIFSPWGYVHNQRKNGSGRDLNRTKSLILEPEQSLFFMSLINEQIDFFLTCHEDSWSRKIYAYAFGKQYSDLYKDILKNAEKYMQININDRIDGLPASGGLIFDHADHSLEDIMSRTGIPSMCSETGKKMELESRIEANKEIIRAVSYMQ